MAVFCPEGLRVSTEDDMFLVRWVVKGDRDGWDLEGKKN